MRSILIGLALISAPCAVAQTVTSPQPPNPVPQVRPAQMVTPPADGALRMAAAFVPGGDSLPDNMRIVSEALPRQIGTWLDAEVTRQKLTPQEATKLAAYKATLPSVVDSVLLNLLPSVRGDMAVQFRQVFTAEEAEGIAGFLETPAGMALIGVGTQSQKDVRAAGIAPRTPEEMDAVIVNIAELDIATLQEIGSFMATPAGIAFKREEEALDSLLSRTVSGLVQLPLNSRLYRDACNQISVKFC